MTRCAAYSAKRRCRRPTSACDLCWQHLRLRFHVPACVIQAHARGRRTRRLVSAVFVPLPHELQQQVVGHMRARFRVEREANAIRRIVEQYVVSLPVKIWLGASAAYVSRVQHLARKYRPLLRLTKDQLAWCHVT